MNNLVWCDVETTGLDTDVVKILELGIVITTPDLEVLFARSWLTDCEKGHKPAPFVIDMHTKSGLWDARAEGHVFPLREAETQAVEAIRRHGAYGSPLCGSSVHFDRNVLRAHGSPILDAVSYRNIDVSSLKELAARWGYPKAPDGRKMHRALPDCLDSVNELTHYRKTLFADYRGLT